MLVAPIGTAAYEKQCAAESIVAESRLAGSPDQSIRILTEQAVARSECAITFLYKAYAFGIGVPRNEEVATRWLQLGALWKIPQHEFLLGRKLFAGLGIQRDVDAGLQFIKSAAESGDIDAIWFLAKALDRGVEGQVSADPCEALRLYRRLVAVGQTGEFDRQEVSRRIESIALSFSCRP